MGGKERQTILRSKTLGTGRADPNTMNVYDQTPLLRTAMNGHEAVVKLLLGKGVDPDHSDEFNQTPLC